METRASYFLVGLFVLALLVSMFGFIAWLSRLQIQEQNVSYYIYFRGQVTGLSNGSAVRYRGVPVGTVTDISIDEDNVELIQVTVAIKPGTPIKTDTIAALQLQGITGLSFVQLSGGTQAAALLQPRPGKRRAVIPSRPSAIEQVFENAPELFAQVVSVANRANEILGPENQKRITGILTDVGSFSSALARSSSSIESVVNDSAGTLAELRNTAASLDVLARELRQLSSELGADLRKAVGTAHETVGDVRTAIGDARKTALAFEKLANQIDQMVAENRGPVRDFTDGGLYELAQFIGDARTLVAALTRLAAQIERDPARFLFGDQQKGFEAR